MTQPQLIGNLTTDEALAALEQTLAVVSKLTPFTVDDRIHAYVSALRKSPELMRLLAEDLDRPGTQATNPVLGFALVFAILEIVKLFRAGEYQKALDKIRELISTVSAQSASAQALDWNMLIPIILEIIKFILSRRGTTPVPVPSGYAPSTENRCI